MANHKVKIQCVETGEVWNSINECALAIGHTSGCIRDHIKFRYPLHDKNYIRL